MIKSVTVENYLGETLELVLTSSHEDHGVYIASIEGIGPSQSNINLSSLASDDGGIFTSARTESRNITMKLGFYESSILHNSIEDSRHLIYKYFPNKRPLRLTFYTDNRTLYTDGYVESNEPDIFSKEETTQISIICPDPNFYSTYSDQYIMDSSMAKFEFPFDNDTVGHPVNMASGILQENQVFLDSTPVFTGEVGKFYFVRKSDPNKFDEYVWTGDDWYKTATDKLLYDATLIFTDISDASIYQIPYDGENETGIIITIHFLARATNITIYNEDVDGMMIIDTDVAEAIIGDQITSGDDIVISTVNGSKSAVFKRTGEQDVNIINALTQEKDIYEQSDGTPSLNPGGGSGDDPEPEPTPIFTYRYPTWFKLQKGMNAFMFSAETGDSNIQIVIENPVAYEGV